MKHLLPAIAAAALLVGTSQASADDAVTSTLTEGSYFAAAGGVNFSGSGQATDLGRSPSSVAFHFHPGLAVSLSGGYKFLSGLRVEIEGSYRQNGVKDFNTTTPITGHQDDISVMANILYEFKTQTRFTPYVGLGVGGVMASWHDFANASSSNIVHSPGGTRLGLQGIAGGAYALSSGVDLTLDFRYKASNGHNFTGVQAIDTITGYHLRAATILAGVRFAM